MNRKQRESNRKTASWLRHQQFCTRCGERGLHYVVMPSSLDALVLGIAEPGFWTCPDLYGPDGRRKDPS